MQLIFSFDDFAKELDCIQDVAGDLLDASNSELVLRRAKEQLEAARGFAQYTSGAKQKWEVREDWPLYTAVSKGLYEPENRGHRLNVQAAISFSWAIKALKPEKAKKTASAEHFTLAGLASIKVRFFEWDEEEGQRKPQPIAVYCQEVGMPNQPEGPYDEKTAVKKFPGCFFHASIHSSPDLTVPRLPSYLFTPVSVIEYVLGELFQVDWSDHQRHTGHKGLELAKIQRQRFQAMLSWHQEVLRSGNQRGSPWVELKRASPPATQFVSTGK